MKRRMRQIDIRRLNFIILVLLFFIVIIIRMSHLTLAKEINGKDLKKMKENMITKKEILYSKRGIIYDKDSNILAQTVNSYVVIACLNSVKCGNNYVEDKENTASVLSEIINMKYETILELLNREVDQVELGPGGRNISELKKQQIELLNLKGIIFSKSYKRNYPYGNFASYILGYVKNYDGTLVGEMGIESKYNEMLNGTNGFHQYQSDKRGNRIVNTPEIKEEPKNGIDIYLTIDHDIQLFLERAASNVYEKYNPEWIIATVADAKTGAILGSTSYPSFDPNIMNIKNYLNPLVSYSYEPGSTMKVWTYMATIEKGVYEPDKTFQSGEIKFGDEYIYDAVKKGWGEITFDHGFTISANTAVSTLTKEYITGPELKSFYEKVGFGNSTGIELPGEKNGTLNFIHPFEIASASFGQGITTTPIQNIQALTPLANNGVLLKPYIIDKIVDTNTNKVIYEGTRTEIEKVISESTVNKMKQLMYDVVHEVPSKTTGSIYKQEGIDIMAKTGTAQYINPETKTYYFDSINYIRSFAGMFPKDDPQYIVYVSIKKVAYASLRDLVNPLIKDIAIHKGILRNENDNNIKMGLMPNLLNKDLEHSKIILNNLVNEYIVLGDGDKVINQYPLYNTNIDNRDKVYLITNDENIRVPKLNNWSLREVLTLCNLIDYDIDYEGSGLVNEYVVDDLNKNITIKLKNIVE